MQPWAVMGYVYQPGLGSYPSQESFFGHMPHFVIWLCVVFIGGACGGGIANVMDASPSRQMGGVAAGLVVGMVIASMLFVG
jgi:hypothetical protein